MGPEDFARSLVMNEALRPTTTALWGQSALLLPIIQRQDWATITENARSAVEIVKRVRQA